MTTLEGDKILIEDKLFEKDFSGKWTKIGQDSSLEFYPADEITFEPKAKKVLAGTNIPWDTIINTIYIHEKRLVGKLSFYHRDWLEQIKIQN